MTQALLPRESYVRVGRKRTEMHEEPFFHAAKGARRDAVAPHRVQPDREGPAEAGPYT